MKEILDTIVIGGGQAGLAAGYHLRKKGLHFLILEASDQFGGSWSSYYDSLKLFSPAGFSSMPGMKFPGNQNRYPHRDEVIRYLLDYKLKFDLPVLINQRVDLIEKDEEGFVVRTKTGEIFKAQTIINATGSFNNPFIPKIAGMEEFQGNTLHSSQYRNSKPFHNQRIIIVGGGNSAVQIAVELAEVTRTSLAVRQPIKFVKQHIGRLDLHFWIKLIGFDNFPFWRFGKTAPSSNAVIDTNRFKDRITAGNPNQQTMFISFYERGVIWPNGDKEHVDTVIFATGFKPNAPYLKSLGALDKEGRPLHRAGISNVSGIYFVGLEGQRSFASATLRGVGQDARFVVNKILKYLK
ncbi:flavin-containing monooxygenase [Solibacillus daqui]|uniref:flavin-containing monooxygenase n=1 Tax=Solibacillus daqui TaxID=2912187 RepID=UPI0023654AFB|nr:NAD(P)/FAD-dependent oxidoreductase [Solibacillus daqui]